MDVHGYWERALKNTEVIRHRIKSLETFESTPLPYILLSESLSDSGDTVVRRGKVMIERPSLHLPPNNPNLEGFDWSERGEMATNDVMSFLMVRGVRFPSMNYQNETFSLSISDHRLTKAVEKNLQELQKEENTSTGLILGPEDCWQFSLLIFVGMQVVKSADGDMRRLMEFYKRGNNP